MLNETNYFSLLRLKLQLLKFEYFLVHLVIYNSKLLYLGYGLMIGTKQAIEVAPLKLHLGFWETVIQHFIDQQLVNNENSHYLQP